MKSKILTLSFMLLSMNAFSQIQFQDFSYFGNGCADGTVSSTVTPDGSTLSILFDEFRIEVPHTETASGGRTIPGRRRGEHQSPPHINQKKCNLVFTAAIPLGSKVESLEISLQARGATILDPGIRGQFTTLLLGYDGLARSNGKITPVIQKLWNSSAGAVDDSWNASPVMNIPLNSGCSAGAGKTISFQLRNDMNAEILDQDLTRHGLITVDSADMSGMLKFTLRTRPCGNPHTGGNLPPRRPRQRP
ncbi:MAG TPA: DUF4360 domain-containing protein [Bacteriovoracaceae bacterium]|nr:DUF4360 domain-containing protein [Bacteriovoracaceae bacterium]